MSEKVSFLIGAGFSAPFGVPTMGPFYSDFVAEAQVRYPSLTPSLSRAIRGAGDEPDLESLLSVLNAALGVESGLPEELLSDDILGWVSDAGTLRSHLLSYIVERCENFDRTRAAEVCAPLVLGLDGSGFGTMRAARIAPERAPRLPRPRIRRPVHRERGYRTRLPATGEANGEQEATT